MRACVHVIVWVSLLIFIAWVFRGDVPFILILYSYGSIEMGAINVVCAIFFSLSHLIHREARESKAILTYPNTLSTSITLARSFTHTHSFPLHVSLVWWWRKAIFTWSVWLLPAISIASSTSCSTNFISICLRLKIAENQITIHNAM